MGYSVVKDLLMLTAIHLTWEDADRNRYFVERPWSSNGQAVEVKIRDGCTGAWWPSVLMTLQDAIEAGLVIKS